MAVKAIAISAIVLLLVWANDGAGTKSCRFKPFIHIVYKGKLIVHQLFLLYWQGKLQSDLVNLPTISLLNLLPSDYIVFHMKTSVGCVHLCRVAGNTVWSHMASDAP